MATESPTVAEHFVDTTQAVREAYDQLLVALRQLGPVHEAPKQGSIHLDNASGFCGVYVRKDYLLLHFRTDYPIDHPRIQKREQLSARRFKHTVKVANPSEIDDGLLAWLRHAYALAGPSSKEAAPSSA